MENEQGRGRQLQGRDVDQPVTEGQQGIRSVREGDPANTLPSGTDQPTKKYRLKQDSPSTWMKGVLVNAGDEVELTDDQARAASQYVETTDGKPVPSERQIVPGDEGSTVSRANLAGLARHERIDALQQEEKRLTDRLDHVRKQIAAEQGAAAENGGGQPAQVRKPGAPAPPAVVEGETR